MTTKTKTAPPEPLPPEEERPEWWNFDVDGDEAAGVFIAAGHGHTRLGTKKPFLELEIDGEKRSVWLHHKAAVSKVRERIEEYGPIKPGERVVIRRSRDKKTSAEGYDYFPYQVEFPDLPQADQYDLFGASRKPADPMSGPAGEPVVDDDIPFRPE